MIISELTHHPLIIKVKCFIKNGQDDNKSSTCVNGHLSIRDCTDVVSKGLIFAYHLSHYRINKNQQWHRKTALLFP